MGFAHDKLLVYLWEVRKVNPGVIPRDIELNFSCRVNLSLFKELSCGKGLKDFCNKNIPPAMTKLRTESLDTEPV